jgi:hypothetical protein
MDMVHTTKKVKISLIILPNSVKGWRGAGNILREQKKNEQPIHGAGPRSMRVAEFSIK